jgi:lipopolysaccharide transport system permease protein
MVMPALTRKQQHATDVVRDLVVREFRLRYRRSLLGWVWALAQPIARLLILSFVFTRILPLDIDDYGVFLFTGLIGWSWFAAAVSSATSSAIDRADLLFRPGLPRAIVPVVSVLTDALDYVAALPVLAAFLLLGPGIPVTAVALPAIMVVQLLLILGVGFAACAANVYLRDVRLLIDTALVLGFYLTPVFYDPSSVPDRFSFVVSLNPVAQLLIAQRDVLVDGRLPGFVPFFLLTVASVAIFVAGYAVYRAVSPTFVDEL